jgi:hypothetical protein
MITNLEIGYNGRLGNQIFQYAACYTVAKKLGVDFVIPKSNVDNIKQDGCFDFANNKWVPYRFRMYDCFNITAPQIDTVKSKYIFQEPNFHYNELLNILDDTSIQGYYQSEKYFIDYKEDILKEFTFKSDILKQAENIIKDFYNNEIVAVHIRRGDNVVNPTFPLISMEYIQQALEIFSDKEYNFLIISDDVPFCKEAFPESENIMFSNGENDLVDLCLMSLAHHNIISNSSFSWWGAYLNSNPNKKIIAPSDWFKDKNINTTDLIPKKWILI